jgi:hypothetical protein
MTTRTMLDGRGKQKGFARSSFSIRRNYPDRASNPALLMNPHAVSCHTSDPIVLLVKKPAANVMTK